MVGGRTGVVREVLARGAGGAVLSGVVEDFRAAHIDKVGPGGADGAVVQGVVERGRGPGVCKICAFRVT